MDMTTPAPAWRGDGFKWSGGTYDANRLTLPIAAGSPLGMAG